MKVLKLVQGIIGAFLLGVIIFLLVAVFIPKFMGYNPYNVTTGSMEPNYHVGSMIYVKSVPAEEICENDVITFQNSVVITHRVVRVDNDNKVFYTKGDANESEDGALPFDKLIGKVSKISIPYMGSFLQGFQDRKQIAVGIIIGLTIIWFLLDFVIKPDIIGGEEHS